MVRATVILVTEGYGDEDFFIVCPFCDSPVKPFSLSYDDYVDKNWLCFSSCGKYLMCKFLETGDDDECTIKMSTEEVQAVCKKYNVCYKEGESRGYKVGVLKLKFVLPSDQIHDEVDDICEDVRSAYNDKSGARGLHITGECFSLNEPDVDLRHDGCDVGYVGECSECGEEYTSHFWGD